MSVPSDFANLIAWYKSDTGVYQDAAKVTPCTDGTTVYTWENQVGGGFDMIQATAGRRPTWSQVTGPMAYPELTFAGGDLLGSTHAIYAQPLTFFIVGKRTGYGGNPSMWTINGDAAGNQIAHATGDARPYIYSGDTPRQSATNIGTSPLLLCAQFNGASSFLRWNKTQIIAANPGTAGSTNIHLMGDAAGTYWMPGSLYEVAIYDSAVSAADITSLEDYFGHRYGFWASSLHSGLSVKTRGVVGWIKKVVVNGVDFRYGTRRSDTEGSPETPSLEITEPNFFRFRWGIHSGSQTISVRAKQASNVTGKRPQLRVKADARLGINSDVTGDAGAGTGWVTIGPVTVTASTDGVVWVELWNTDTDTFNSPTFFDHVVTT